jgi:hypothetical protein
LRPGRSVLGVDSQHPPEGIGLLVGLGDGKAQQMPGLLIIRVAPDDLGQENAGLFEPGFLQKL